MNPKLIHTITLVLTLLALNASAEIVVIVNSANPVKQLSNRQLVDMYMGRNINFADGSVALRLDQEPNSEDRQHFYEKLVNKSVAEVNAYWARLLFTGRTRPPKTVEGPSAVLEMVRSNPQAIGYIDSQFLNDNSKIKVVGRVD